MAAPNLEGDERPTAAADGDAHPSGLKVLLVEDDHDTATLIAHVLRRRGGHEVFHTADPSAALRLLDTVRWDVLVSDYCLPGMDGVGLLELATASHDGLGALLITAHPTVEVAVGAFRGGAVDFLTKPIDAAALLGAVEAAARRGRAKMTRSESILAIGAHPDDVELGVGATLLAHAAAGDRVHVLTMSRGAAGGDVAARVAEAEAAARHLGAELVLHDLADTAVPDGMPTVPMIEEMIAATKPDVIYTHSVNDLHQDHRSVHRATLVAARSVAKVYCYQSPSATVDFRPSRFVSVDEHMDGKLAAVSLFASQVERSPGLAAELLRATALYWGRYGASRYAEPLEVVRDQGAPARELSSAVA